MCCKMEKLFEDGKNEFVGQAWNEIERHFAQSVQLELLVSNLGHYFQLQTILFRLGCIFPTLTFGT